MSSHFTKILTIHHTGIHINLIIIIIIIIIKSTVQGLLFYVKIFLREIFRKTKISQVLIPRSACAYQEVGHDSFSENFACGQNGLSLVCKRKFFKKITLLNERWSADLFTFTEKTVEGETSTLWNISMKSKHIKYANLYVHYCQCFGRVPSKSISIKLRKIPFETMVLVGDSTKWWKHWIERKHYHG